MILKKKHRIEIKTWTWLSCVSLLTYGRLLVSFRATITLYKTLLGVIPYLPIWDMDRTLPLPKKTSSFP